MSTTSRSQYTSEFKESTIQLAKESGQSVAKTAKDLGINVNTLHNWMNKNSDSINMSKNSECHFDEVKKLRKELAIVKQERDLLKKAAAYFAKESR
jgi:transposase